jgi:BirA family transcriptional regulator, biotin operon repressor / biotin---[acetyl-CoA-carboxylase] ligase
MDSLDLKNNIIHLISVDSTNNYANLLIKEKGANEGTVILADLQNKGKGQLGNSWESEAGRNLTFSIILRPRSLPAHKQFYLSMAVSLGIVRYLQSENLKALVKWPNDIYIDRKKIAGILIENTLSRDIIDYSIVGIGLNVNQEKFLSDAPNPTSVLLEKNQASDLDITMENLLMALEYRLEQLYDNKFQLIRDHYLQYLMLYGKLSNFSAGDRFFSGIITDVKESGELIVQMGNGRKESFGFKEIGFPY